MSPRMACGRTYTEWKSWRNSRSTMRKDAKAKVVRRVITTAAGHSHHSFRSMRRKFVRRGFGFDSTDSGADVEVWFRNEGLWAATLVPGYCHTMRADLGSTRGRRSS